MDKKMRETRDSFDYQWANLKDSPWLLSSAEFKEKCERILLDELHLSAKDISNKFVLDVGCGNGRWSYAFRELGAKVVAYDYTRSGSRETKKLGIDVALADALNPPFKPDVFDIVFSFGVLHHTGNLEKAFRENARFVKPGGIMHVYLYSSKGLRLKIWRLFIHSIPTMRMRKAALTTFLKIREFMPFYCGVIPYANLHGGFDALSPSINVESDDEFVRKMFRQNRFKKIVRVKTTWCNWKPDIHMNGVRK